MSNNLYMIIELNGKTYKYPFFQVSSPDNTPPYTSKNNVTSDIQKTNGFKQYESDLVPLFSFLELPRQNTNLSCVIDGKKSTIEIQLISELYEVSIYRAIFRYKTYKFEAYEPVPNVYANQASQQGTCFGFNYTTNEFVKFAGGTSFSAEDVQHGESNFKLLHIDYGNSFYTNYPLPKFNYLQDVPTNIRYTSKYYPSGWSTATFEKYIQLNSFQRAENYEPIEYPNQDPDDEDGDDRQPTPDPPILGDGDTSSDPIPDPPPQPAWDVSDTGFVVIYNPTVQEIRQLAYFMWSGDFADLIKKVFAEPFAALISLKMLFCPVTAGASQTVWLGNVETTVSMSKVTKQFTDIDLGSVNITEFFGSFADYAPFTKIQIFLPFIGYKDLNTDEVMNSSLHLRYRVDVYSGACIAFLTVTKNIKSTQLNSILYQFDGNCAMEIPFTSNDNSRYVSAILNSAASSALSLANTSAFTSAQPPFMFDKGEKAKFTLGSLAPVANGMLDIMSTKPNVQRAGSLAGAVSAMGVKQPYIIIHRPIQHMPANYNHFIGIPLNLSRQLSAVKGYTIISQVFISSQTATDDEITMITELLKSGVIL